MNRYIKTALYYTVFGLVAGVFYREFTKFNGVDGGTSLVLLHVHSLMLGMTFFLILSSLEAKLGMSKYKEFKLFNITYNLGLVITIGVFLARGITQTLGIDLNRALDMSMSGIGGIGHILLAVGIITMFVILNKATKKWDKGKGEA